MSNLIKCELCGGSALFTHSAKFLSKFHADYYRCKDCEFWFVLKPFWLEEAYSDAITIIDTGLVARNIRSSVLIGRIIGKDAKGVDWSGGTGLFTRLMRDKGFDFYWYDPYSLNIHARGFEYSLDSKVDVVTMIEVLEHIEEPLKFLKEVRSQTDCKWLIFTQEVHTNVNTPDWWYFMSETGQHISFYSRKTLSYLGQQLDLDLYNFGNFYLLARLSPKEKLIFKVQNAHLFFLKIIGKVHRSRTKTWEDHIQLKSITKD